jgi:hypothetical protein
MPGEESDVTPEATMGLPPGNRERQPLRAERDHGHGGAKQRCSTLTEVRSVDTRGHRQRLGQSEVEQLGAGLGQHHVTWLEVAMDDAGAVRAVECVGDVAADLQQLGQR